MCWVFSSFSIVASWRAKGREDLDISETHALKHLIQAEVKFPKIKSLCITPHTFLTLGLTKWLLIVWFISMVTANSFGEKFCSFSSLSFPTHRLFKKQCLQFLPLQCQRENLFYNAYELAASRKKKHCCQNEVICLEIRASSVIQGAGTQCPLHAQPFGTQSRCQNLFPEQLNSPLKLVGSSSLWGSGVNPFKGFF